MELLLIEEQVKTLIVSKLKLSSNEKTKRIIKTLKLINKIFVKYHEELEPQEAYDILFGDDV